MVHKKGKWVSTDAWRGYWQPSNSIIGQSIFGEQFDRKQQEEDLAKVKNFLKQKRIPYRVRATRSSNVFMAKRWVIIPNYYSLSQKEEKEVKEFAEKETQTFHD
jgi:hypothetical protein